MDWRASKEILDSWERLKINREFACVHTPRECNSEADRLAKLGIERMGI